MKQIKRKIYESKIGNRVIGWGMTPVETQSFFKGLGKNVVTFFGYSGAGYQDKNGMLQIAETVLSEYSPKTSLINIGATKSGIGRVYPIAQSMGFITTGIVSSEALECLDEISAAVDHICFVKDEQWGGKLLNSNDLSPTSGAMVACTDILIGIGGGEIGRDELIAGREQGKPVRFYPAEMSHEYLIRRAQKLDLPSPISFLGAAHEVFADKNDL